MPMDARNLYLSRLSEKFEPITSFAARDHHRHIQKTRKTQTNTHTQNTQKHDKTHTNTHEHTHNHTNIETLKVKRRK